MNWKNCNRKKNSKVFFFSKFFFQQTLIISLYSLINIVVTLACSALKTKYRKELANGLENIDFFALKVDKENLIRRLKTRTGHFMSIELLDSQLATWEDPNPNSEKNVFIVNANENVNSIVSQIFQILKLWRICLIKCVCLFVCLFV